MAGALRFTYDGDPSASPRDAVRFYVGDTNRDRPLLSDGEVDFALAEYPNQRLAASTLAEHLAARFAREADFTVGPISKSFGAISEKYRTLANLLRTEACKNAVPSFPATKYSTKKPLEENEDLTKPSFAIDLGDNPYAIQLNEDLGRIGFRGFY